MLTENKVLSKNFLTGLKETIFRLPNYTDTVTTWNGNVYLKIILSGSPATQYFYAEIIATTSMHKLQLLLIRINYSYFLYAEIIATTSTQKL